MPKTRLDRFSAPKRPPMDRPKALILERMGALDVSNDDMAAALDMSAATWQTRKKAPTTEWKLGELIKACVFLGVSADDLREAIRFTC